MGRENGKWRSSPELRDVLTRLPKMTVSQIPEVPPEAWAKAERQGGARQACA